ncbi:hypothetical protein M1D80_10990 [Phyllobacteriaceae bacterium JZ32]
MSGWATFFVSIGVAIIGVLQWRTAHAKVVLDLFDRRWRVFQDVSDFYFKIIRNGVQQYEIEIAEFHKVRAEGAFLFGEDVQMYVKELHEIAINISTHAFCSADEDPIVRHRHIKAGHDQLKKFVQCGADLRRVFSPYMRMKQKLWRTPKEWFRDRNELRLSYSDNKD